MAPSHVVILGHSFIHHLEKFLGDKYDTAFLKNFNLSDDLLIRWHRIGGRTVTKTTAYNLRVVQLFAQDNITFGD